MPGCGMKRPYIDDAGFTSARHAENAGSPVRRSYRAFILLRG